MLIYLFYQYTNDSYEPNYSLAEALYVDQGIR
jgi:hypothetical protein